MTPKQNKRWKIACLTVAAIALFASVLTFAYVTKANGDENITGSIGALYRRSSDNSLQFSCTVSALTQSGPNLVLLTADHCVEESQRYYHVTFDGLQFYVAELHKIPRMKPDDPKVDLALLLIKGLVVKPLGIGKSKDTPLGAEIFTIGFPQGISKIMYKGYIGGVVDNVSSGAHGYLILQIFGSSGSSGTAVLSAKDSSIMGVLVSGSSASVGLPVLFATPIEYLRYLVTPAEKRKMAKDNYAGVDP